MTITNLKLIDNDTPELKREKCIASALDGLERTVISLVLWTEYASNQVERNAVDSLLKQAKSLLRQTSNFSRMG